MHESRVQRARFREREREFTQREQGSTFVVTRHACSASLLVASGLAVLDGLSVLHG